jgi:hypothetical protein
MKKIFLILTLILPFMGGCKKEKKIEKENPLKQQIVGQWTLHTPARGRMDRPTLAQYTFDNDGNYQYFNLVLEPLTNQVLGYQSKSEGKYRIEGDEIVFYDIVDYRNEYSKNGYSREDELVKTTSVTSKAFVVITKDVLKLNFPCPPYVACIGVFWYQRQ